MRRFTWKCSTLLAFIALTGCAAKNADMSINTSQLTETGLVYASLSTSDEYMYGPIATVRFERGGIIKAREEDNPIVGSLKPSELQDDYGRLVVLELPLLFGWSPHRQTQTPFLRFAPFGLGT